MSDLHDAVTEYSKAHMRTITEGIDNMIKVALDDYFAGLPWSKNDLIGRIESTYRRKDKRTLITMDGVPLLVYYDPEFKTDGFKVNTVIKHKFLLNKALAL